MEATTKESKGGGNRGRVFLVGAGPGDPGLLTIKAANAIGASDVVVYDYLVNPEILVHSAQGAELIFAGKHAGGPSISQADINRILIGRALNGQVVTRLKGGDPFVFGRGGEEAEALTAAGIEWELIPGVTSGVAAAAYAGIPLTHRDFGSTVAFITGHPANGDRKAFDGTRLSAQIELAAHADTVVVFMCGQSISEIAGQLIIAGRPASTPVAIVRWATYEHQQVFIGALSDLTGPAANLDHAGGLTTRANIKVASPAIAIIGNVVGLADKLAWFPRGSRHTLSSLTTAVEEPAIEESSSPVGYSLAR